MPSEHIDHGADYKLVVEPTESRVAYNENDSYTYRVPFGLMKVRNPHLLRTIVETAGVAFSHNKPGSKKIVMTCPKGMSDSVQWLVGELSQEGFQVDVRELDGVKFMELNILKGCSLGCVDRRMDDTGVDPIAKTGQITHAGGPLILDPALRRLMIEQHQDHLRTLEDALFMANRSAAPINRLDYHFGVEGGGGCGMYGVLSRAHEEIRDLLKSPSDIVDMLKRVRDAYGNALSRDCSITGTVVGPENDSMIYDLDDSGDVRGLLREDRIVL